MAKLSSRPHRTEPAGSYVKPDWKGYVKAIAMKRLKQYHIVDVLRENFEYLR